MKKRSAWFAAWFAVLIIGVVAMMAVAPMGKASGAETVYSWV